MRKTFLILIGLLISVIIGFVCTNCRAIKRNVDSNPVSHEIWDALLKNHVDNDGFVDYKGFIRDSVALNEYLHLLESAHPSDKNWSRNEQMAYWINAYNAFTVQLITRHYPIESIKDIKRGLPFVNSVWDIKFIHIQGFTYDLNNIEHNILRPVFKDARVHAAINCASFSCPKLRREAFTATGLEAQLDSSTNSFINDPLRNRITMEQADISKIFQWFNSDFERDAGSVRAYLNRYANVKLTDKVAIRHIDYNWTLNAQQPK